MPAVYVHVSDTFTAGDCGVKTRSTTGGRGREISTDEGGVEYGQGKSGSMMGDGE